MKDLDNLAQHFQSFPGIGPRQAKRFVYHLLRQEPAALKEIAGLVERLRDSTVECDTCHRFYAADGYAASCDICTSPNRDGSLLMVVEKDADLEAIERSGTYDGRYFVLGGTVPLLETAAGTPVRIPALAEHVRLAGNTIKEIIIATGAHPEGEATADDVRIALSPLSQSAGFTVTLLGRGLSTGTELEYSDAETIRNALQNRR